MRVSTIIDYIRDAGIQLDVPQGSIIYKPSPRALDKLNEGSNLNPPPIKMMIAEGINYVFKKLLTSIYLNYRVSREKGFIDFQSIRITSENASKFLNLRIVRLSSKSCVLVGYISSHQKSIIGS